MSSEACVEYEGAYLLRQRIVLSTLTGRPIRVSKIRPRDSTLGLADFEVAFLNVIDTITNGAKIVINETGTCVTYFPGLLSGGGHTFDCGTERCISYFLEPLLELGPFMKTPLRLTFTGVTNCDDDPSVDELKTAWLPVFRKFVLNDETLDIKVNKRGLKPEGGGEVYFSCPIVRQLRPVQLLKQGRVKKIRGLAYAAKVSPLMGTRMIESAKGVLKDLLGDVFITSDHRKGSAGGSSPGYGLFLSAETTEGVVFVGEAVSRPSGSEDSEPSTPEDIGVTAAHRLLQDISRIQKLKWRIEGGCVTSSAQSLACLFMVLGQKDISKLLSGPLSQYTVGTLRSVEELGEVRFRVERVGEECDGEGAPLRLGDQARLQLTVLGAGFTNINKTIL